MKADYPEEPMPKLLFQCIKAYESLDAASVANEIEGEEVKMFVGHSTKHLEEAIGLTTAKYGRVMKALKDMGCVIQYKRGAGRTTESQWILVGEPTVESFVALKDRQGKKVYNINVEKEQIKVLRREVNDLKTRLSRLESRVGGRRGKD